MCIYGLSPHALCSLFGVQHIHLDYNNIYMYMYPELHNCNLQFKKSLTA